MFLRASRGAWHQTKKHGVSSSIGAAAGILAGTFAPMLENWISDRSQERTQDLAIQAATAGMKADIANLKNSLDSQWKIIQDLQQAQTDSNQRPQNETRPKR
jgi:hypothetical protein